MFLIDCLAVNRYIAKTLYGDDDEDVSPQNSSVEEPKVLGINPGSTEKVCFKFWTWNYFIIFKCGHWIFHIVLIHCCITCIY